MEFEKKKQRSQQNRERQAKVNFFEELEEAAGDIYFT
jgi:phage antirepressor YoqD-like protein